MIFKADLCSQLGQKRYRADEGRTVLTGQVSC